MPLTNSDPSGTTPVPDPTSLTTEHINTVKSELRNEYRDRFGALNGVIDLKVSAVKETISAGEADILRQIASADGALRDFAESHFQFIRTQIAALTEALAQSVNGARLEAQTANDALQKLLEASMAASTKLQDVRFSGQEMAISKTETAISVAKDSTGTALMAAMASATAAVKEIDTKSQMRHETAIAAVNALDTKFFDRLGAQQALIDLRAKMNDIAIDKANEANEKRFASVNEFRTTLSDQAREFITTPVLTARTGQLSSQLEALDRQSRLSFEGVQNTMNGLASRLDRGEASNAGQRQAKTDDHSSTGNMVGIIGGAVGVLTLVAMLGIAYINNHNQGQIGFNPTIGADTKRVDDLVARLDAMTRQSQSGQSPGH
jgi:hypothetical protein